MIDDTLDPVRPPRQIERLRGTPISEIYGPVIQGEGQVAGVPTVFVRVGGCDYRCSWCDSLYAVLPQYKNEWTRMENDEIYAAIAKLAGPPCLITFSGGNPALYDDLGPLVRSLAHFGYKTAIETQGTKMPEWAPWIDSITVSPKPPSSEMVTNWNQLDAWVNLLAVSGSGVLKVVVFSETDYEYARDLRWRYGGMTVPFYLQAGTNEPYQDTSTPETMAVFRETILQKLAWLQDKVIADKWYEARVLPQIHALINGAKRGV